MRGVNATPGGSNASIPVNAILIGDNSTVNGSNPCTGIVDLTGGSVDILATQIVVGRDTINTTTGRSTIGSLGFDTGTIDVIAASGSPGMIIGQHTTSGGGFNCTGTVTVGSAAHLIVSGELQMASFAGGTTGSATATLNINGGTVTMGGDIDKGATLTGTGTGLSNATINLTGGTLDMGGHNIGVHGSTVVPIDTFTMHGGTLANLGNLAVTNFTASGNVSLPSGTLTIGSGGKIDMRRRRRQHHYGRKPHAFGQHVSIL